MTFKPTQTSTASGKARFFPLAVAFAVLLFGSFAATQHVASALSYQPALGEPLLTLFEVQVYQPLGWAKWYLAYRHINHPVLDAAFIAAARYMAFALVIAAGLAIFLRYLLTRDLQKVTPDLHGTAHWMKPEDVRKSGLIGTGEGVYIGGWTEVIRRLRLFTSKVVHYLRHNGPEHILAIAPTRSGKGVGLVIPTLLSWPHSTLVYDIKGEAWALTAGWRRAAGQKTLRFDPADPSGTGVCFNPLDEVRLGTEREVGDVQNLVTMIVDPDGKGLNDHWAKTGHALLVGAVLHVLYAEPNKTLCGVADFLSDPSRTFEDALNAMLQTEHDSVGDKGWTNSAGEAALVHPVVAASARDMLNKADNERSGVLSTAMSFLTLYRDPIVAANTSRSEFKIHDLMNDESPVSLYLVVRPSDKDRLKPLTRLVVNQIVRGLTEKMEFKGGRSIANYKHRLLLLIDEFPSLGKLEIFEEALAFIAGYGMKAYLIIQDIAQLQKHYGREESITSNCHIRIAYAPNRIETAKMLSEMVGTTTVVKNTYSYSGKRSKTTLDSISAQASEVSRPLLTPDEIMRLKAPQKDGQGNITDAGDMLIFQAGMAPILGTQILYFLDPTFNERSQIEPPAQSDRIRSLALLPSVPPPARPVAASTAPVLESASPEAQDDEDDYECPPLTDDALVGENEAYPEAADYAVAIAQEDEDPPLGRELMLPPDELAALLEADDEESEDDPDPVTASDEPAPEAPDPFLSASLAWSSTLAPPPAADLNEAALPQVLANEGEAEQDEAAEAAAPAPVELDAGDGNSGDPYLALSRRWADRPPAPAGAAVAAGQSERSDAADIPEDGDAKDALEDFDFLAGMAQAAPESQARTP